MMRLYVALLLVPIFAFSIVPSYRVDDPALSLENPREFFSAEIDLSAQMLQNLLTIDDLLNLVNSATITIDKSRLDLIAGDVVVNPFLNSIASVELGTKSFKIGAFTKVENTIVLKLPKDLARILLGDMDFEENIDEEFNMFEGGILAKAGAILSMRFGSLGIGLRGGIYLPVAWFDPESKVRFVYVSDPDTGSLHASLSGGSKFFTPLSSFENIDTEDLLNQAGYFIDAGVSYKIGKLFMGVSVENVSIKPSILKYYAFANVTFSATLENLNFEMEGPDYSLSENIEALEEGKEISAPMSINAVLNYNLGVLNLAGHFKTFLGMDHWEAGGYVSIGDVLFLDVSMLSEGYWKKILGLNLDLRVLRLSASLGVLDTSILNFDTKKMVGMSFSAGVGIGF